MKDEDGSPILDKEGKVMYECPVVNWINEKLQVANPSVQLPKITFEVKEKRIS
jgi:hypothetical protein